MRGGDLPNLWKGCESNVICPKCRKTVHVLDWSAKGIVNIRLRVRKSEIIDSLPYIVRIVRSANPCNDEGNIRCPSCGKVVFTNLKEATEALLNGSEGE